MAKESSSAARHSTFTIIANKNGRKMPFAEKL